MSDSADDGGGDASGPKQVTDPDYHSENHTAAQTCGWTKNAMRGDGTCYKHAIQKLGVVTSANLPVHSVSNSPLGRVSTHTHHLS
jgi:tRNA wybutosine-synthesizing protein 1